MKREIRMKVELYNDNFENFKRYNIRLTLVSR